MNKCRTRIHTWLERHNRARAITIIILLMLCVVEVRAIAMDFYETHQIKIYEREYLKEQAKHPGKVMTIDDIKSWMTFSYINFVFKLPTNYLLQKLSIFDFRYPNIHIERYAKMHNLDQAEFLLQVKQAVSAYKL